MSMNSNYDAIASIYDSINADIDYSSWADFIEECFKRYMSEKPSLVLDLACGTGRMTFELHKRGYDMIGADASESMLNEAYDRAYDNEISDILFIKQDMRDFELYGTVGAICSCLDSINYLTEEGDLEKCFASAHNYLDPDGLFIFDVNTPYKFENVYGNNHYIFEDVDSNGTTAYCGWQNEYDKESGLCSFYLSVFSKTENGLYERNDEEQLERCYTKEQITDSLIKNGFEVIGFYSDFDFSEPDDSCERWYIVAKAKK
ncbi:MAG: class I SAM-dependent methyltransferase [Clostridia bacterium]|nr:class I SAM-dependent methyltransferase [Clostridia bacterium]